MTTIVVMVGIIIINSIFRRPLTSRWSTVAAAETSAADLAAFFIRQMPDKRIVYLFMLIDLTWMIGMKSQITRKSGSENHSTRQSPSHRENNVFGHTPVYGLFGT